MKPGTYKAHVVDVEIGESRAGTPWVALRFETETGETVVGFRYLSDRALPYTLKDLRMLGWAGNDIDKLTAQDICCECEIVVAEEVYEGKTQTKVKYINSIRGTPALKGKLSPEARSALSERIRSAVMAIPSKPKTDDELPF